MMSSIVVLNMHIQNIKTRSSKLVIESDAQKKMAKSRFGCKFPDLKYFKVKFYIFLKITILLRASIQKIVKKPSIKCN